MKWTNQERLHAYGVRLVGWPADIPLQNPSILKATQNTALLEALRQGSMRFERLNWPPGEHSATTNDTTADEDISWACNDAGEMSDETATSLSGCCISALPPETLLEIFDACRVIDPYIDSELDLLTIRAGPPAITAVCGDWRRLALSSPSIWTDIHVNIYTRIPSGSKLLLETLLSLSVDLPLRVCIVLRRGVALNDQVPPLLRLLVEQSMRWASLQAHIDTAFCESLLPAHSRLPLLHTVRFSLLTMCDDAEWAPFRRLFSDCPALTDFEGQSALSFMLPWEQLHRLNLRASTLPVDALERTTHVRALRLSEHESLAGAASDAVGVLHRPHLHKATLDFNLLRRIRAPSLSECHISDTIGLHTEHSQPLQNVTEYVRGHPSLLTALSLRLSPIDSEALQVLLAECPTLHRLQIQIYADYEVPDKVDGRAHTRMAQALLVREGEAPLLPNLCDLRFMILSIRSAEYISTLGQVIQSRSVAREGLSVLQSFTLKVQGLQVHTDPRLAENLAQLSMMGCENFMYGSGLNVDVEWDIQYWRMDSIWQSWIDI
ncbi:hypothetical protein GGG16DRAFT_125586 [Schizophyllum commune]